MNVSYTVHFKGIHEKQRAALDKMLRADIAVYPERMSMDSATVEEVKKVERSVSRTVKDSKREGTVSRAAVKATARKVK